MNWAHEKSPNFKKREDPFAAGDYSRGSDNHKMDSSVDWAPSIEEDELTNSKSAKPSPSETMREKKFNSATTSNRTSQRKYKPYTRRNGRFHSRRSNRPHASTRNEKTKFVVPKCAECKGGHMGTCSLLQFDRKSIKMCSNCNEGPHIYSHCLKEKSIFSGYGLQLFRSFVYGTDDLYIETFFDSQKKEIDYPESFFRK
ncbi:unnamed protein product [Caenorhabditis auriculariae]|uniref:Uncharacterized protein n=1 Tax=Caenorhabditis auriculariae TaxID=2777116 RepID=A0A8S1HEL0_9PELO|nr:unnamed protein product [Caenorhabditis auriculariae]